MAVAAVAANSNSTPKISQKQNRFEHNREKSFRGNKIAPEPIKFTYLQISYDYYMAFAS